MKTYIGISSCFNFKLKSVQRVLHEKGIMNENFSETCGDGLESMKLFQNYLEYCKFSDATQDQTTKNFEKAINYKKILEHYNFIDCSTLDHLDSYFRTKFYEFQ